MKRLLQVLAVAAALALGGVGLAADAQATANGAAHASCTPSVGLHYVCGLADPEDLALIPGTHWIVSTGMATDGAGGLFLIDARSMRAHKLALGSEVAFRADRNAFPGCPGPPDPSKYYTQGLNLRRLAAGRYRLNVVSHGTRESIEVYDVAVGGTRPTITWRGCVRLPDGNGNAVTSSADGTLYATIFFRHGTTFQDMIEGKPTGDVYVWHGGNSGFELIPGLSFSGDNGIEISRDGRTLYLALTGTDELVAVSLADPGSAPRRLNLGALGFSPDNVHWTQDGHLIVAGMREAEPDCGGLTQRAAYGQARYANCHRAPMVALVDPSTLQGHVVFAPREASPSYTGTSTALVADGALWLGSFGTDRVAYVPLPHGTLAGLAAHSGAHQ
jgi:hypothetical protein